MTPRGANANRESELAAELVVEVLVEFVVDRRRQVEFGRPGVRLSPIDPASG
jgi:hypothetical protein